MWTASGGPDYAGKPRPVVVVQDDQFAHTLSITVCPVTTNPTDVPFVRPVVEPNDANGLRVPCRLMVDKIATIPKRKLGKRVGKLSPQDLASLNRSLFVFLGLG